MQFQNDTQRLRHLSPCHPAMLLQTTQSNCYLGLQTLFDLVRHILQTDFMIGHLTNTVTSALRLGLFCMRRTAQQHKFGFNTL